MTDTQAVGPWLRALGDALGASGCHHNPRLEIEEAMLSPVTTTRRTLLTGLGALSVVAALPAVPQAKAAVREGGPLPDVKLTWLAGQGFNLSDAVKDKVVLLNFWATWCGPCLQELPALDSLHRKLAAKKDVDVLAINVDQGMGLSFLREFWGRYKLELPLAVDASGRASSTFRLSVLPMSYVVAKDGNVRYALAGARNWQSDQWVRGLESLAAEGQ